MHHFLIIYSRLEELDVITSCRLATFDNEDWIDFDSVFSHHPILCKVIIKVTLILSMAINVHVSRIGFVLL